MKTVALSLAALAILMLSAGTASAGGVHVSTTMVGHYGSPYHAYHGWHRPVVVHPPVYGHPPVVVPFPVRPPLVRPPVHRVYRYPYYPRPYGPSFSYRGSGFAISIGF